MKSASYPISYFQKAGTPVFRMFPRVKAFVAGIALSLGMLVAFPHDAVGLQPFAAYSSAGGSVFYSFLSQPAGFGLRRLAVSDIGGNVLALAVADADGDGNEDIFYASGSGTVYLLRNTGVLNADRIVWEQKTLLTGLSFDGYAMSATAGDYNSDGRIDFILSGNSATPILLLNRGNFVFTTVYLPAADYPLRAKASADFDGDGDCDFAAGEYSSGVVWLYRNDGTGSFSREYAFRLPDCNAPFTLVAGDFDSDGKSDLIAGGGNNGDTWFYRGTGTGGFFLPEDQRTPLVGATTYGTPFDLQGYASADALDYDGDGDLDLLLVNTVDQYLYLCSGSGNGQFDAPVRLSLSLGAAPNTAGAVAAPYRPIVPLNLRPQALLSTPASDMEPVSGLFTVSGTAAASPVVSWQLLCGAGLNPVAWTPVASGSSSVSSGVIAQWDTAGLNGVFTLRLVVRGANGRLSGTERIVNCINPVAGQKPIVVVSSLQNELFSFTAEGNASFGVRTYLGRPGEKIYQDGLAVADLDKDGDDDILLAVSDNPDSHRARIDVLFNDGRGVFTRWTAVPDITAYNQRISVAVLDLDSSGYLDIVMSSYYYSSPVIFSFVHNGPVWDTAQAWGTTYPVLSLRNVDANSDGRSDLLGISPQSSGVIFGAGQGRLTPLIPMPGLGTQPTCAVTGDLNDDDASEYLFWPGPSLYVHNSVGEWVKNADLEPSGEPAYAAARDIDSDGFQDLLTISPAGELSYRLHTGMPGVSYLQPVLIGSVDGAGAMAVSPAPSPTSPLRPLAAIYNPVRNSEVKGMIPVQGAVAMNGPVSWVLDLTTADGTMVARIGEGSEQVFDGQLALFDSTTVANGVYALRLTATPDSPEESSVDSVKIQVNNRQTTPLVYHDRFAVAVTYDGYLYYYGFGLSGVLEPSGFLLNADGSAGTQTWFANVGSGVRGVAVADFNHDGFDDVLTGNATGELIVLKNSGPYQRAGQTVHSFIPSVVLSGLDFGGWVGESLPVDLDSNDYPDAVMTGNGAFLYLLYNNNGEGFTPVRVSLSEAVQSMTASDIDEDGILELIYAGSQGKIYVLKRNGSGYVESPELMVRVPRGYDKYSPYPDVGLAAGDFDQDGHSDIAVLGNYLRPYYSYDGYSWNWYECTLSIFSGSGNGAFNRKYHSEVPMFTAPYSYARSGVFSSAYYSKIRALKIDPDDDLDLFFSVGSQPVIASALNSGSADFSATSYIYNPMPAGNWVWFQAIAGSDETIRPIPAGQPKVEFAVDFPNHLQNVKGIQLVWGDVSDSQNDLVRIEIHLGRGVFPVEWQHVNNPETPPSGKHGLIGSLDTSGLNGLYTVRMMAFDAEGNVSSADRTINLVNPSASPRYILSGSDSGQLTAGWISDSGQIRLSYPGTFPPPLYGLRQFDADQDGDMDFVALDGLGTLRLFVNAGNESFDFIDLADGLESALDQADIAVGDFNADGWLDFSLTLDNTRPVLFLNNGNLGFSMLGLPEPPGVAGMKIAGDFNADGRDELLLAVHPGILPQTSVRLYSFSQEGTSTSSDLLAIPWYPYAFCSADFDGDGFKDIIAGRDNQGLFSYYKGAVSGFLPPVPLELPFPAQDVIVLDAGDYNADGFADLFASDYQSTVLKIFPGDGAGSFGPPVSLTIPQWSFALSAPPVPATPRVRPIAEIRTPARRASLTGTVPIRGDVSGGSYLLECGKGLSPVSWSLIASGQADGSDVALGSWDVSGMNGIYTIRLRVFSSDGGIASRSVPVNIVTELPGSSAFMAVSGEDGSVWSMALKTSGVFGPLIQLEKGRSGQGGITALDLDGDSDDDFVTADLGGGVFAYISDSAGSFSRIPLADGLDFEFTPTGLVSADFDTDGRPDLLLSGKAGSLILLRNLGGLEFERTTLTGLIPSDAVPVRFAVVDLDGNPRPDLLCLFRSAGSYHVAAFTGNGVSGFSPHSVRNVDGFALNALAGGDINEDGYSDFITGGGEDGIIKLWTGDSANGFSPVTDLSTPLSASRLLTFQGPACIALYAPDSGGSSGIFAADRNSGELLYSTARSPGFFQTPVVLAGGLVRPVGIAVPSIPFHQRPAGLTASILVPSVRESVKGEVPLRITASGPDFKSWKLLSGKGSYPDSWTVIAEGTEQLQNALLSTRWQTSGLNGLYTLRLVVRDSSDRILSDNMLVNCVNPVPAPSRIIAFQTISGKLMMTRHLGGASFSPLVKLSDDSGLVCLGAGDLDGDGDDDIIDGEKGRILLNDGTDVFSVIPAPGGLSGRIIIADLDADGNQDLITSSGSMMSVWYGQGGLAWTEQKLPVYPWQGYEPTILAKDLTDVNEDGKMDIIFSEYKPYANSGADMASVWAYLADSSASGYSPVRLFFGIPGIHANTSLHAVDFDGDSHVDVISGGYLWKGDGKLGFRYDSQLDFPSDQQTENGFFGSTTYSLWAGSVLDDFDGDGILDFVVSRNESRRSDVVRMFLYFLKGSPGSFSSPNQSFHAFNEPMYSMAARVDPPVLRPVRPLAQFNSPARDNLPMKGVVSLIARIAGAFSEYRLEYGKGRSPENWTLLTTGNRPLDGLLWNWDTAGMNGIYTLRIRIFSADGSFHSIERIVDLVNPVTGGQSEKTVVFGGAYGIFAADYSAASGAWSTVRQVGSSGLSYQVDGLGVADFDADGDLDYIACRYYEPSVRYDNGTIVMGVNDGTGGFSETVIAANAVLGSDFAVADFNNDDLPDFVSSDLDGVPRIYLNNADCTFTAQSLPSTGAQCRAKDTADLDRDGWMDLAIADSSGRFYLYYSKPGLNGSRTFVRSAPVDLPAGSDGNVLSMADYNQDGEADVVCSGQPGELWILLGDGAGRFFPPVRTGFPETKPFNGGRICALGEPVVSDKDDFDQDGKLDLVLMNARGWLYFLKGMGDGNFEDPVFIQQAVNPGGMAISASPYRLSTKGLLTAEITTPGKKDLKSGQGDVLIQIAVSGDDFVGYKFEYGKGGSPEVWQLASARSRGGNSYYWDSSGLNGVYSLRLSVWDSKGRITQDQVLVNIKNEIPNRIKFAAIGNQNGEVYIYPETGSGFGDRILVAKLDSMAYGLSVFDSDNDGDLDVLASEKNGTIHLFINDGNQNFFRLTADQNVPYYTDAMDIREDAFRPFVGSHFVFSKNDRFPEIYGYNNFYFSSFSLPSVPSGERVRRKSSGLIPGDTLPSLFCLDYAGNIWSFRNQSSMFDYTFEAPRLLFTVPDFAYTFLYEDFNEDGVKDFVIGGDYDGVLRLYSGSPDGSFSFNSVIATFGNFVSAVSSDFDSDGFLDLLTVDYTSDHLWLIRGRHDSGFEPPVAVDDSTSGALGIAVLRDRYSFVNIPPTAALNKPERDEDVNGLVHVSGMVWDTDFDSWKLEAWPADDPSAVILISSGTEPISGVLASWDTTSLPNGNYILALTARESTGRETFTSVPVNLVPPSALEIGLNPGSPVKSGEVVVRVRIDEPVRRPPLLSYLPSGSSIPIPVTMTPVSGDPLSWNGAMSISPETRDGPARFYFEAEDEFGNVGTFIHAGADFVIDTVPPVAVIELNPASPLVSSYASVKLAFNEPVRPGFKLWYTLGSSDQRYYLDSVYPAGINQYRIDFTLPAGIPNGSASFGIEAYDLAGNSTTTISSGEDFEINRDQVLPIAVITTPTADALIGAPVQIVGTASDDAAFAWYKLEAIPSVDPSSIRVLKSSSEPVVDSVLGLLDPSGLTGDWIIRLTSCDLSGNIATTEVPIVIGEKGPELSLVYPSDVSGISDPTPTFSWTLTTPAARVPVHYVIEISETADFAVNIVEVDSMQSPSGFVPNPPVMTGDGPVYFTVMRNLPSNRPLYWRVSARIDNETIAISRRWSFEIR